jgi:hypothetical protein
LIRRATPAWPISWLLIGYPLWWALGLADFMWIILAVPMALRMIQWVRRGRRLRVPPAFGLWLLFLVCALIGAAMLGLTAPGTAGSSISHRFFSYANRSVTYVGITILLLYAGNLTERELPRRRLAWMLGLLAIYTTLGGLAAIADPHFQFSSPTALLLPRSLQSNAFIQAVTHPGLAQLQNVLGGANARPKALFDYTNTWAECLTLLIPWLLVGWWVARNRGRQLFVGAVVVLAGVTLLYSLNRGAWVGAALLIAFLVVRHAVKRPAQLIGTVGTALAVVAVLAFATPVSSLISGRVQHGASNNLRASLDALSVKDALASPVLGYGDTRKQIGSHNGIARGPTAKCAICGQQEVGSTGQLWLLLVCNGIVGTILYLGFFVAGIWRFRRDRTPYGHAGLLILVLSLFYTIAYDALPAPLGFTMLAYALLWRSDFEARSRRAVSSLRGRWRLAHSARTHKVLV